MGDQIMTHEDKIQILRKRGQTLIADEMQAKLDEVRRKKRHEVVLPSLKLQG